MSQAAVLGRKMPFLKNAWYVGEWAYELSSDKPFASRRYLCSLVRCIFSNLKHRERLAKESLNLHRYFLFRVVPF
jgi:hypothetical protein